MRKSKQTGWTQYASLQALIVAICLLVAGANAWAEAVIYEPFADSDTTLVGNTPGTGLTGLWVGAANPTNIANQTYGELITGGNAMRVYNGWANNEVVIDASGAYTALLADGGEMWFSVLYEPVDWNNNTAYARFAFAIGDDGFSSNGDLGTSTAQAIGLGMGAGKLFAGLWTNSNWGANNLIGPPASAVDPNQYKSLSTGELYLVVGHVAWGANDATDYDTVTLYAPGTDLALGSAIAISTGIVSQSSFNLIATHNGNSMTSIFDEIRVGATYADVTPQPPPSGTVIIIK